LLTRLPLATTTFPYTTLFRSRHYGFRFLNSRRLTPEHIAIGTATDPYQPAERDFGAMRAILEQMAEREGLSVSITTKSNQVVREIARAHGHTAVTVAARMTSS